MMFSKTSDPTAAPASPAVPRPSAPGSNSARSVLGPDLKITGEISSSGSVEVLGEIDGNITANGLIIGQEGRVKGSVTAHTVEVKGKFDGKIGSGSRKAIMTFQERAGLTPDGHPSMEVLKSLRRQ